MRDLRWFLVSGLVVVLWLSLGPRVAAAPDEVAETLPQGQVLVQ